MTRTGQHRHHFGKFMALTLSGALLAGLVVALLAWSAHPARAQGLIVVNTTADDQSTDGECSLREAIVNANDDDKTSPDCRTGDGEDTIVFLLAPGSTITLGSELPTVTDAAGLTIAGGGAAPTVSGNEAVRVLSVGEEAELALRNLTVADGSAGSGGGIQNKGGTLTVTNSTFSGNKAVGMSSMGIIDCGNACFGGGIDNDGGTLTVTRSTFSDNGSDAIGGGINNTGTLEVTNSTFSGNSAAFVGGGINNGGTLEVTYSTFSDNVGSGAINNGNVEGATVTLSNTILANKNTGGNIRQVCAGGSCQGTIIDGGYNISDDDSTSEFFTEQTSKSNTDPEFSGDLANNGGPTQTIAIQPTSPALNAIPFRTNGCGEEIRTDQRGVRRPQGSGCDIGSFERRRFERTGGGG